MNQSQVNQAGVLANGAAPMQQQPLASSASPAAIQASEKQQFIKVDTPYEGLKLELRQPIVFEGKPYQQMVFREANLQDFTKLSEEGDTNETMVKILSNMTNNQVPAGVFMVMPLREMAIVTNFFMECAKEYQPQG